MDYGIVSRHKEDSLRKKMSALGIYEQDISEQFVRSSGRGGQNVNKVSTCVYLKHIPTGTEVKCQEERSQSLNRYHARRLLAEKIETLRQGRLSAEQQRIHALRKQKRRRSRRAQAKVLEGKRKRSEVKASRQQVRHDD